MNLPILILLALATFCMMGCGDSSLSKDSFRLIVTDVFTDDDQRVCVLTIEARRSHGYTVFAGDDSFCARTDMPLAAGSNWHRAKVWVAASRISYQDKAHVQTIIGTDGGKGKVVREVPRTASLNETISLTIRDGSYAVASPLIIGRVDGRDLTLMVGGTSMRAVK
ncbi:MAG: hypothetical protein V4689_05350 [Verrucomicrobiota bacterium]